MPGDAGTGGGGYSGRHGMGSDARCRDVGGTARCCHGPVVDVVGTDIVVERATALLNVQQFVDARCGNHDRSRGAGEQQALTDDSE